MATLTKQQKADKAAQDQILLQRTSARVEELINLGLLYQEDENIYFLGDAKISVEEIRVLHDDVWDACVKNIISTIDGQKEIPASEGEIMEFENTVTSLQKVFTDPKMEAEILKNIEAIKAKCNLKLSSLSDKKVHEVIYTQSRLLVKMRTTLDNCKKVAKADILEQGRIIDSKYNKFYKSIQDIEAGPKAELEKWEAWKDEERTRKEREEQAELDRRVQVLKDAGMTFNGIMYVIGQTRSIDLASIKALSQADLNVLVGLVTMDKQKMDEEAEAHRQAEQARKDKEEADRVELKRQQDELAENQRKQEEERTKFAKEKEDLAKQKQQFRMERCKSIGMKFNFSENHYEFINDFIFAHIAALDIQCWDDAEFEKTIDNCRIKIDEARQMQSDKDACDRKQKDQDEADRKDREEKAQQVFLDRCQQLMGLGMVKADYGQIGYVMIYRTAHGHHHLPFATIMKATDKEWPQILGAIGLQIGDLKEYTKRKEEEDATAKEAAKSDIQKMREYLAKIEAIESPGFEDEKVIKVVKPFFAFLKDAIGDTKESLSALEK